MAVFADMGASLLVVFNGLRLLRKRFKKAPLASPCPTQVGLSPARVFRPGALRQLCVSWTRAL
ncbi:hypothetical protein, partial [Escherichia coli]|uniref:hypothetical protein n=1 Tax=Escherichia coli TaxID=562 RepID=UPI00390CC1F8